MRAAEFARVRTSLTSNFGIPLADVAGTRREGTGKSVTFVTAEKILRDYHELALFRTTRIVTLHSGGG